MSPADSPASVVGLVHWAHSTRELNHEVFAPRFCLSPAFSALPRDGSIDVQRAFTVAHRRGKSAMRGSVGSNWITA